MTKPADTHLNSTVIDDLSLAKIIDMGFSMDMARNALVITRGQLEEALNLLISSPDRSVPLNMDKILFYFKHLL